MATDVEINVISFTDVLTSLSEECTHYLFGVIPFSVTEICGSVYVYPWLPYHVKKECLNYYFDIVLELLGNFIFVLRRQRRGRAYLVIFGDDPNYVN